MRNGLGKRFIAVLSSAAMIFSFTGGNFTSENNLLEINTVSAEDSNVLSAPTNICWKVGSTATAQWDAVEGANYYEIDVFVYNGDELIGSSNTGTNNNELDIQQEINNIVNGVTYNFVYIAYTVKALKIQDDKIISIANVSQYSDKKVYTFNNRVKLANPQDLLLNEQGIVSWSKPTLNLGYSYTYGIEVKSVDNRSSCSAGYGISLSELNEENGRLYMDLSDEIIRLISNINGTQFNIKFSITAEPNSDEIYFTPSDRITSNVINYAIPERIKLENPQNLLLDEQGIVSWSKPALNSGYSYTYGIEVKSVDNRSSCSAGYGISLSELNEENGRLYIDLSDEIIRLISDINGTEFNVKFSITAEPNSNELRYSQSDRITSNVINYAIPERIKLENPQNLSLDEQGIVSWSKPALNSGYSYTYGIEVNSVDNRSSCSAGYGISLSELNEENGRLYLDLSDEIIRLISNINGTEFNVKFSITAEPNSDELRYSQSDRITSNTILFYVRKAVDIINVSPDNVILCKNNFIYLGKTITPEDAYYTTINWTSSNSEIVSVDSMGRITGVSVGTADITAKIGKAEDTVTVTVYEISSNIEKPEDMDNVTDTAGSIIDDIANNDEPNLDNTDIPEEKIEDIKQEIQDAVENGNTFHTDIKAIQETFDTYKNNWGQVQKAANDLNAQFAGAYNIEVEMYHKDKDDEEHHIGNITELDNEITFTFDLPTGNSGKNKRYVLVRIHKNSGGAIEYSPVDVTINDDGTFTAKSNKFSDFVLLVSDLENDSNIEDNHNYNNYGYCKDCGNIQNGTDAFVSAKAVVGGQIAMKFKVALSDEAAADSEAGMVFSLESGKVISIPLSQATLADSAKNIYEFTLTLTSTQMDEKITAKMQYSDAIAYNENTQASVIADYSVNKYLDNIQNQEEGKDNPNTKLINVIKAMRTYGVYIDIYSGDTNSDFTPEDLSSEIINVDDTYTAIVEGAVDGVTAKAASLTVSSLIDINIKFNVTGNIENYTFMVDGAEVQPVLIDGVYCVKVAEISPLNYSKMYNISVTDGQNTMSIKYSALSYVKNKLNGNDEALANVCKAMYLYNEAVKAYA